jgi:hypothetical protein
MRNSKFMRWDVILLGLVVLCTNARNRFCPMCTKGCCMVLTRSKPFWGQICETDSHTHRSNKCAALVPLRNAGTYITGFTQVKSPTNQYISFILPQEVVCKTNSTPSPHTAPVTARNTPVWARSHRIGVVTRPAKYHPKIPAFRGFLFYRNGIYLDGISLYR